MRDYVPQIEGTIAKASGPKNYLIKQAALWRRDIYGFPGIANSLALEGLWHHDKLSWGGGYEFGSDFYSVDSSLNTNALNLSELDFSGWSIDHLLYGKFLIHLKHDYKDGIFGGVRAGVLLYQAGFSGAVRGNLGLSAAQTTAIAKYPASGYSFGLYGGLIFGLRFFIFPKALSVVKPGFRVFIEYGLATDSANFNLGALPTATKLNLNYGGLTANINLFISLPRQTKKPSTDE